MYLLRLVTLTYLFRHRCHDILHASAVLQVALKKQKTKKRFDLQPKGSVSGAAEANRKMFISTVAITG